MDFERDWLDDARRYLTNIVGKYGPHIQLLLKKAGGVLDQIKYICPLHGPVSVSYTHLDVYKRQDSGLYGDQ